KASAPGGNWHTVVKPYLCPSDPGVFNGTATAGPAAGPWGAACYAANVQAFGDISNPAAGTVNSYQGAARFSTSFPDGTSQTILFAEKYASCGTGVAVGGS